MNMRVAKEEMALLMPVSLSNYADEARYVEQPATTGLFARLSSALSFVASLPARYATFQELSNMSERELADIGLQRNELTRVFDEDFVAKRPMLGRVAL